MSTDTAAAHTPQQAPLGMSASTSSSTDGPASNSGNVNSGENGTINDVQSAILIVGWHFWGIIAVALNCVIYKTPY